MVWGLGAGSWWTGPVRCPGGWPVQEPQAPSAWAVSVFALETPEHSLCRLIRGLPVGVSDHGAGNGLCRTSCVECRCEGSSSAAGLSVDQSPIALHSSAAVTSSRPLPMGSHCPSGSQFSFISPLGGTHPTATMHTFPLDPRAWLPRGQWPGHHQEGQSSPTSTPTTRSHAGRPGLGSLLTHPILLL